MYVCVSVLVCVRLFVCLCFSMSGAVVRVGMMAVVCSSQR